VVSEWANVIGLVATTWIGNFYIWWG
jgi:hypothetical protein